MLIRRVALAIILLGCPMASAQTTQIPDSIAAKGETVVLTVRAEGAQIYDCKADNGGKLSWQFREPIATLIQDGNTVGRHYAGPTWEHVDGSRIAGKAVALVGPAIARTNGPGPKDIAWLKLEVVETRGAGALTGVTAIQRINTHGGQIDGACDRPGATAAAPYTADYVFLRK